MVSGIDCARTPCHSTDSFTHDFSKAIPAVTHRKQPQSVTGPNPSPPGGYRPGRRFGRKAAFEFVRAYKDVL